jgi:cytochrome c5
MKSGEKLALRLTLVAFLGIAGFTAYLELDYRKTSPTLKPAVSGANADKLASGKMTDVSASRGLLPKGVTPNNLPNAESRGATLVTLYCGQCHNLPTPVMHSAQEWPAIMVRMQSYFQASKNGILRHVILPPQKDLKILEAYLTSNAQPSLDPLKYDDIATQRGQRFISTCSQCHTAPSPKSHTKNEWPRVVLRMKANMQAANLSAPEQSTLLDIIDFLQHHSKTQE